MLPTAGRVAPLSAVDGLSASTADVGASESRVNRLILDSGATSATSATVLAAVISGRVWLATVDCTAISDSLSAVSAGSSDAVEIVVVVEVSSLSVTIT